MARIRCPQCRTTLPPPSERPDGLPGIKYDSCPACGWSGAVTAKPKRERLPR